MAGPGGDLLTSMVIDSYKPRPRAVRLCVSLKRDALKLLFSAP